MQLHIQSLVQLRQQHPYNLQQSLHDQVFYGLALLRKAHKAQSLYGKFGFLASLDILALGRLALHAHQMQ